MRCVDCGELEWSLRTSGNGAAETCRVCGGELRVERRRPGRRYRRRLARERRDVRLRAPVT